MWVVSSLPGICTVTPFQAISDEASAVMPYRIRKMVNGSGSLLPTVSTAPRNLSMTPGLPSVPPASWASCVGFCLRRASVCSVLIVGCVSLRCRSVHVQSHTLLCVTSLIARRVRFVTRSSPGGTLTWRYPRTPKRGSPQALHRGPGDFYRVEPPGIEPGSFDILPGLLRAQFAQNLYSALRLGRTRSG